MRRVKNSFLRDRNDFLFNFSFIEWGDSLLERTMMDDIRRKKLKIHAERTEDNSPTRPNLL